MSARIINTDEALLQLMSEGDQIAFSDLYDRYWKWLVIVATKLLRSEEDAADVVQDVFLSLWNRRREIQIETSLSAYLNTSVRYKVRDYIAKNVTRRNYLALLTDTAVNTLPASAEIRLQLKEVQQIIKDTVSKMPARMQEVYKLSRQEHLSNAEIAIRMGISSETVRKQIQNALALIQTSLGYIKITLPVIIGYILF